MASFQWGPVYHLLMIIVIFTFQFVSAIDEMGADSVHPRSRRSLVEFAMMIKCATGRWAFDYNGYGCYCGKGGGGKIIDDVDRCCKEHDDCYGVLLDSNACSGLAHLYWRPYRFTQRRCSETNNQLINCYSKRPCSKGLCKCDREAAHCFARATYNDEFKDFDRMECLDP